MNISKWLSPFILWAAIAGATTLKARDYEVAKKRFELGYSKTQTGGVVQPNVQVDGFVAVGTCYQALTIADANEDYLIDFDEYAVFVQELGPPGFLDGITEFSELPLILQSNFFVLACSCRSFGSDDMCCVGDNARLNIQALNPDATPNDDLSAFLFSICWLSGLAVDIASERTPTPTSQPSDMPSKAQSASPTTTPPTDPPSPLPSGMPVQFPSGFPSLQPTISPTLSPSGVPSLFPSGSPTSAPTALPSSFPTDMPSRVPTTSPTFASDSPTVSPSDTPTTPPTGSPSGSPTIQPSVSPTFVRSQSPTAFPSNTPTLLPSASPSTVPTATQSQSPSGSIQPTVRGTEPPSVSIVPSDHPSVIPTDPPTNIPSEFPSTSIVPSDQPSDQPSIPSSPPSLSPTISSIPSNFPSNSPTDYPTVTARPTDIPSAFPSIAPSIDTSSSTPTETPTIRGPDAVVRITYEISVTNGLIQPIPDSSFFPDLIDSMDILAIQVEAEVDFGEEAVIDDIEDNNREQANDTSGGGSTRHRHLDTPGRRRLIVIVDLPTSIDGIIDTVCDQNLADPTRDRCGSVTASIGLLIDDEPSQVVQQLYLSALNRAILNGRLQLSLDEVNPDSPVTILTGLTAKVEPDDGLPVGFLAGVAIGAAAMVGCLATIAVRSCRSQDSEKGSDPNQLQPAPTASGDAPFVQKEDDNLISHPSDDEQYSGAGFSSSAQGVLGAIKAEYGEPPSLSNSSVYKDSSLSSVDSAGGVHQKATSSLEGSSGWSTNFDTISSASDVESGLKRIDVGAGSGIAHHFDEDISKVPSIDFDSVDFAELDSAIQIGDWRAVASSAEILLAAMPSDSHSQSQSSVSLKSSVVSRDSWKGSLDVEKAAVLDSLIQAGDWAGVVHAAKRFEVEENSSISETGSNFDSHEESGSNFESQDTGSFSQRSSSGPSGPTSSQASVSGGSGSGSVSGSASGSMSGGSRTYPSFATTLTDQTPSSKARRQEEIRREVEAMVQKVVPEELDHVDEMMSQFKGREDELIETLRNMQERDIARKARKTTNRQVKLEARQTILENRKQERLQQLQQEQQQQYQQQQEQLQPPDQGQEVEYAASLEGPRFVPAHGDDFGDSTDENTRQDSSRSNSAITSQQPTLEGSDSLAVNTGSSSLRAVDESDSSYITAKSKFDGSIGSSAAAVQSERSSVGGGGGMAGVFRQQQQPQGPPSSAAARAGGVDDHHRAALLTAIDQEDWEAVGEAAAILGETDSTKWSGTLESIRSTSTSDSIIDRHDRRELLTQLIEEGDWPMVVVTASRFIEADKIRLAKEEEDLKGDGFGDSEEAKREKQLKEEEAALAQAEMWMEIAKQAKRDSSSEEQQGAASDAADWAIARSLSSLQNQAKKEGDDMEESSNRKADDDEEESV